MARLFLDGKDLGPHPFFVQIRSLVDHTALPGIEVGDIGPKMGFQAVDNGFLRFGAFVGGPPLCAHSSTHRGSP